MSILFSVLALCLILAMAWIVIKFLSRIYSGRIAGGEIQIRSTYALGSRQQLYVINFRNIDYFLGVTGEHITVIDSCAAELPDSSAGKS